MKKALLSFVIMLVVVVLGLAGVIVWAYRNPADAWKQVERYFLPADLQITQKSAELKINQINWLNYEFRLSLEDLLIVKADPEMNLPFSKVMVDLTISLFGRGPGGTWFAVREVAVAGGELRFVPSTNPEPAPERSPFEMLRTYLSYLETANSRARVERLSIEIPKLLIGKGGEESKPLTIQAKILKPADGKLDPRVAIVAGLSQNGLEVAFDGMLDARNVGGEEAALTGKLNLAHPQAKLNADLEFRDNGQEGKLTGKLGGGVRAGEKTIAVEGTALFSLKEKEALLQVTAALRDIPGPIVRVDKLKFELRAPLQNGRMWSEIPAQLRASTSLDVFFVDKNMRPPLEKSCRCKIPEKVAVELSGRAWLGVLLAGPLEGRHHALDLKLSMESVKNKLFSLDLAASAGIFRQGASWLIEPVMNSTAVVHSYQGVRQFLDAKNIMIPAPFDVLEGTITLSARGAVAHDENKARTSIEAKFDLASASQKILVESTVALELDKKLRGLDAYVTALIRRFQIELPPLEPIMGVPPLGKDKRVLLKPEDAVVKAGSFRTRVFLDVKTMDDGSIRLLSKFADPYVPISLSVNTGAAGESSGFVRAEPFVISYLRRKVNLERLQINLADSEASDFPVVGRVRIDSANYKIYIDVSGTLDQPIIQMNSEPSLSRADIISVLLYNRVSDQLASADAETVGGVEAAVADRAIGIFGLWAFASTPIQSFSYNPVSKVYTATVKLTDDLTAGIGTNWERAAHLEVRKRVSRRWVLTASWSPTQESDSNQVGQLVLQWERRF